jgi:hypothetical protein
MAGVRECRNITVSRPRFKRVARQTEQPSQAALAVNADWMGQDLCSFSGRNRSPFSLACLCSRSRRYTLAPRSFEEMVKFKMNLSNISPSTTTGALPSRIPSIPPISFISDFPYLYHKIAALLRRPAQHLKMALPYLHWRVSHGRVPLSFR